MAADNPEDKAGMFHLPLPYLEQCDKAREDAKRGIKEVKFLLEEYDGYTRHAMLNFIGELFFCYQRIVCCSEETETTVANLSSTTMI